MCICYTILVQGFGEQFVVSCVLPTFWFLWMYLAWISLFILSMNRGKSACTVHIQCTSLSLFSNSRHSVWSQMKQMASSFVFTKRLNPSEEYQFDLWRIMFSGSGLFYSRFGVVLNVKYGLKHTYCKHTVVSICFFISCFVSLYNLFHFCCSF